jgi:Fe-S-cluster containining protein
MEKPGLRIEKYPLSDEVKEYLIAEGKGMLLSAHEEYEQPLEIDQIEQSVVLYVKNLFKHEHNELNILQKFYRKIQPYYDYYHTFNVCKNGCGCCCYMHVDVTNIDCALINKELQYEHKSADVNDDYEDTKNEHVKCPFLKDNSCSVYSVRPFTCRNYNITADDDGFCSVVKNFGKGTDYRSYGLVSPNIEYAYLLISAKYTMRKGLFDDPVDLKKYYAGVD